MEEQKISLAESAYLQTIDELAKENTRLRNQLNYTQLMNQQLVIQIEKLTAPAKGEKEDVQESI